MFRWPLRFGLQKKLMSAVPAVSFSATPSAFAKNSSFWGYPHSAASACVSTHPSPGWRYWPRGRPRKVLKHTRSNPALWATLTWSARRMSLARSRMSERSVSTSTSSSSYANAAIRMSKRGSSVYGYTLADRRSSVENVSMST